MARKSQAVTIENMQGPTTVLLKQTSKRRYDELRRSGKSTVIPRGIVYEDNHIRRLVIIEDGVYYESVNTLFHEQTTEMLSKWNSSGVETYTLITYTPPMEEKAA